MSSFLSVALSLSSRWPGVTRHPAVVEPGLSSNIKYPRPSSPLTSGFKLGIRAEVKLQS